LQNSIIDAALFLRSNITRCRLLSSSVSLHKTPTCIMAASQGKKQLFKFGLPDKCSAMTSLCNTDDGEIIPELVPGQGCVDKYKAS
jgi:hypothetical protein